MVDTARFGFTDYDSESSSFSVNIAELSGANFDAQAALVTSLRTATNGITIADVESAALRDEIWNTTPVVNNPFAQREIKWQIVVEDSNGDRYRAGEVPCADLDLLEGNSKYIIKNGVVSVVAGAAAVGQFKTDYEALALSKAGLSLVIWDMFQVGRNT